MSLNGKKLAGFVRRIKGFKSPEEEQAYKDAYAEEMEKLQEEKKIRSIMNIRHIAEQKAHAKAFPKPFKMPDLSKLVPDEYKQRQVIQPLAKVKPVMIKKSVSSPFQFGSGDPLADIIGSPAMFSPTKKKGKGKRRDSIEEIIFG